jgi:Tol biopolymer transport system component
MEPQSKLFERRGAMKEFIWLVMWVLILSGTSCEKKLPVDCPVFSYQVDYYPAVFTDSLGKKTIAYYSNKGGPPYYVSGIFLCDFEQREPKLLLRSIAGGISFSPDGNWIVFSDQRIWKIKVNGDSLTFLAADEEGGGIYYLFPDWSPDGKKIAFEIDGGPERGIYLMDPDGKNRQWLTFSFTGGDPAWSPDGNKIYFSKWTPKDSTDTTHYAQEIFCYDFSTQKERRLTYLFRDFFNISEPSVSPSGEKVVFAIQEPRKLPQVWIMGKNGENPRQVTSQGGCNPVFVSENEILYSKVTWGDGRLWLIAIDGQNDKPFFKK